MDTFSACELTESTNMQRNLMNAKTRLDRLGYIKNTINIYTNGYWTEMFDNFAFLICDRRMVPLLFGNVTCEHQPARGQTQVACPTHAKYETKSGTQLSSYEYHC